MKLKNGNIFFTDQALESALLAQKILKDTLGKIITLGVEYEQEDNHFKDPFKPIVSCLLDKVQGVHTFEVDVMLKTVKKYERT